MSLEKKLNISVIFLRERKIEPITKQNNTKNEQNENGNIETPKETNSEASYIKEFLLRKNFDTDDFMEVRVAVVGNVDSGKSTLLGVLTHCVLDDGRGDARNSFNI